MASATIKNVAEEVAEAGAKAAARGADEAVNAAAMQTKVVANATGDAVNNIAGSFGQKMFKQTGEAGQLAKTGDDVLQQGAKTGDNLVEQGAKTGVETTGEAALRNAAVGTAKVADSAKGSVDDTSKQLQKEFDDASKAVSKSKLDASAANVDAMKSIENTRNMDFPPVDRNAADDVLSNLDTCTTNITKSLDDLSEESLTIAQKNIDEAKEILKNPNLTKTSREALEKTIKSSEDSLANANKFFKNNDSSIQTIKQHKSADEYIKNLPENMTELQKKQMKNDILIGLKNGDKEMMAKIAKHPPGTDAIKATNESLSTITKFLNNSYTLVKTPEGRSKIAASLSALGILAGFGYLGYVLIDPKVKADKINKSEYLITSVANGSTSDSILITYEPTQSIDLTDIVKISQSFLLKNNIIKSNVAQITKIVNSSQIEIKTKGALTTDISKVLKTVPSTEFKYGLIKIETNYNTQLKKQTSEFGKTIGSAAGGIVGGASAGATGMFSGVFEGLFGFSFTTLLIILCVIICFCFSIFILFIFLK